MQRKSKNNFQWQETDSDELISKLPLIITDIRGQKKNQNRFSLFHNDLFLLGISSKSLIDYSIQKGVNLTPSLYQKLLNAECMFAAREKAFQYLSRRDHAAFELKQKLQKKGYSLETIEPVLQELTDKNLLSDHSFAVKFANDKAELNRWGPNKIKIALLKKGVHMNTIQECLKNTFENLSQEHICVDLIDKRKKHFLREEDLIRRKQKVYSYLSGRGFSGTEIKKAISLSGIAEDV